MIYKMKKHFVIFVFLEILFCKDGSACFEGDAPIISSTSTSNRFYEECCCNVDTVSGRDLEWLDPDNQVIGPGTDSSIFTEDLGSCLALLIPSPSKTQSGTYKCVVRQNPVGTNTQLYSLDFYDPLEFYHTSKNQNLTYGTDSTIYCKAKASTLPYIKWTRGIDEQNELQNSDKYHILPEGITVKNVSNEDAGIYKCSASVPSTGEAGERDIDVKILTMPAITHLTASPENIAVAGESVMIECQAEGLPEPEYIWSKVSDKKAAKKENITWQQENNVIRFNNISVGDAGIYNCIAKNSVGNASKTIEMKVLVSPTIINFPNRTEVEGSEIIMHCNATGSPTPHITIIYEENDDEQETPYEEIMENDSLLRVNRSMAGVFTCNASNEVDFVVQSMYLTVLHPPYFQIAEELIWGWNGEAVHLNCFNEAIPKSSIVWSYKARGAIISETYINENLQKETNSSVITIEFSKDFDPYGLYECRAMNSLGEAVKRIDLREGSVPPLIGNVSAYENATTSVIFDIELPEHPNTTEEIYGPEIIGVQAEYDLVENYNITNIHKNRTWALGIPFKLEKLKPNSTYYIRFAAVNRVGKGPWGEQLEFGTLAKSAPEPPIWQVDSLQFSTNVLKWKAPEDNGEPIDYYALRYCPIFEELEESQCKTQRIEAATEHVLSDLQFNTTYFVELTAHNVEGNSSAANITLVSAPESLESAAFLSGGVIIGLSVVVVIICLVLMDLLFLFWKKQGIIASCCYKKSKKKPNALHSRDKKGLLKDNAESRDDTLRRPNNGHREFEYNKTTGIITGKHSSV